MRHSTKPAKITHTGTYENGTQKRQNGWVGKSIRRNSYGPRKGTTAKKIISLDTDHTSRNSLPSFLNTAQVESEKARRKPRGHDNCIETFSAA